MHIEIGRTYPVLQPPVYAMPPDPRPTPPPAPPPPPGEGGEDPNPGIPGIRQ